MKTAFISLIILACVGCTPPTPAPTPEIIIKTVEIPGPQPTPQIIEKVVTVYRTPEACEKALDAYLVFVGLQLDTMNGLLDGTLTDKQVTEYGEGDLENVFDLENDCRAAIGKQAASS